MLRRAIETYQEVAGLPDVPADLVKLSLKRRSDRQQFLGKMESSLNSTCHAFCLEETGGCVCS